MKIQIISWRSRQKVGNSVLWGLKSGSYLMSVEESHNSFYVEWNPNFSRIFSSNCQTSIAHVQVNPREDWFLDLANDRSRAEKSTYLATVRLEPSWDLLNLRANFQKNQKFLCFLRAVTSLFHDIRTDNCMYNHIGYKESCKCTD